MCVACAYYAILELRKRSDTNTHLFILEMLNQKLMTTFTFSENGNWVREEGRKFDFQNI